MRGSEMRKRERKRERNRVREGERKGWKAKGENGGKGV